MKFRRKKTLTHIVKVSQAFKRRSDSTANKKRKNDQIKHASKGKDLENSIQRRLQIKAANLAPYACSVFNWINAQPR